MSSLLERVVGVVTHPGIMIGVGSNGLVNEIRSGASSVVGVVVAAAFKCFAAFVFGWADCTGSGRG